MTQAKWALAGFVCILAGALAWTASAQTIISGGAGSPRAKAKGAATLEEGLATRSGVSRKDVRKVLKALGPAVAEQLLAGRQVELPGVGTVRVVRIDAHRDLGAGGRPIMVPARNYVEFVAQAGMDAIANQPGAVPARTVGGFEFVVNPSSTPSVRTEYLRTNRTRP
jgi:nucleoid DNA-binding protein